MDVQIAFEQGERRWGRGAINVRDMNIPSLKAKRVLEVACGDGFLSEWIADALPGVDVTASDSLKWTRPEARMNAGDQRRFAGIPVPGIVPLPHVEKIDALSAVRRARPDLVIIAWPPPGDLVVQLLRAPCRYVLELSSDGDVCGSRRAWGFHKEFLDGAIAQRALCRLDARPGRPRATRATLYYGARHPRHGRDLNAFLIGA